MRSPSSGPITTLLIFVPLVAVPLLAIFGTPQLSGLSPSAQIDDLKFAAEKDKLASKAAPRPDADLIGGVQVTDSAAPSDSTTAATSPGETAGGAATDPFAGFDRPGDDDRQRTAAANGNSISSPSAAKRPQRWANDDGNALPQKSLLAFDDATAGKRPSADRERATAVAVDDRAGEQAKSQSDLPTTGRTDGSLARPRADRDTGDDGKNPGGGGGGGGDSLKWKNAIARLNALGIHDFQLQPGDRAGEFHFSCRFASRTNPRIVHRFEAEAGEPLQAVEQVLEQIDEWKAGRQNGASARAGARAGAGAESRTSRSEPDRAEDAGRLSATDVAHR